MKKLAKTLLVLAALAGATLTLAAFRYAPGHRDPSRFVTNRVEDLLDDVKATDAQRQQILAIKDRLLAEGKALHAKRPGAHQELLAQWESDRPDVARIHALVDARAAEMKAFADGVADALVEVHGVLTPEQRAVVTRKLKRHLDHDEHP